MNAKRSGGVPPPLLCDRMPAFSRNFASFAGDMGVVWLGYGFLRWETGEKRANRFKLDSLALPRRLGGGQLDRFSQTRRLGRGKLRSLSGKRHPGGVQLYSRRAKRRLADDFLCSLPSGRHPGRVFLCSDGAARRLGTDFLCSFSRQFPPCGLSQSMPLSQRPLRTNPTKTNKTYGR